MSENFVQKVVTSFYEKEQLSGMDTPSSRGQLILTNRRLVYIKYPEEVTRKFLGSQVWVNAGDFSNRIEEGLKNEGSFEIPIGQVRDAVMVSGFAPNSLFGFPKAQRFYYLNVRYQNSSGKKTCCFFFIAKESDLKSLTEEFANNIERLINESKG
ncbi:MAG: hypothetical protein ABSB40_09200 [Nitrososphaeria archaeon]